MRGDALAQLNVLTKISKVQEREPRAGHQVFIDVPLHKEPLDRRGVQRPSHHRVPRVHELQKPMVDSRATDASNAWRVTRLSPRWTQSSRLQHVELQQTRPTMNH
jgi:hypothetical protein